MLNYIFELQLHNILACCYLSVHLHKKRKNTNSTLLFTYSCTNHIPIVPEVPFVNDTFVGDPLLSVPLTNTNFDSLDLNVPEGEANEWTDW